MVMSLRRVLGMSTTDRQRHRSKLPKISKLQETLKGEGRGSSQ
jgi:hypothetical protein